MAGSNGTVAPENQSRGVANHGETSTAVGSNHNGRAYIHALARVLQDVVHDDQHHRRCRQVIKIG